MSRLGRRQGVDLIARVSGERALPAEITTTLVPVLSGLSTHYQTRSEFAALRQTALDLLRLGQQLNDTASELVGNRSMALCLFHLGEFRLAREHFQRVLSIYIPETHHLLTSIAAFDMRAVALSYLALDLLILGYPEQGRQWNEQALIWNKNFRHPHTLAFSLHYAAIFGLLGRAEPLAEELGRVNTIQRRGFGIG